METTANNNELIKIQHEVQIIMDKRNEVNRIQKDLDVLMDKLNGFVADNRSFLEAEDEMNDDEKQDGAPEKALISNEEVIDALYVSDESNPPEINWQFIAPIFQKQLDDLAKLQNLNHMMNSIVKRIRDFTEVPKEDSTSSLEEEEEDPL